MTEQQIINELDSIIAYYDVAKEKAAGLRKKLSRIHGTASRKRVVISDEEIAKVLAGRRAFLSRKAQKVKDEELKGTAKKLENAERRAEYNLKTVKRLRQIVNE